MFYLADAAVFGLIFAVVCLDVWGRDEKTASETSLLERDTVRVCWQFGFYALLFWMLGMGETRWLVPFLLTSAVIVTTSLRDKKGRANIAARWRSLREGLKSLPRADKLLLSYVALMCGLAFVLCLAPPSGSDYDALTYHLAAPQRYLNDGRIHELAYDHHTYFPFTVEMWFMLGLSLKGPVLAKLFHWMCLPLGCAALWAFTRRHAGMRAASWSAALWVSLPVVMAEATTAYIDLGFALWVLLAFGCAANWRATNDGKWLMWAGAFGGFALGTKYLGALTVGFLGAWALGRMMSTRRFDFKPLLGYAGAALLLGGGWYLRNALWTGNPVFPFAYGTFGGKGWTAAMAQAYTEDQQKYGFGRGVGDALLAPWRLSMTPLNALLATPRGLMLAPQPGWPLSDAPLGNGHSGLFESQGLTLQILIGPPLLAFGLPAILMRRKPAALGLWLWGVAFFGAFWFFTGQYLRYLLPAFALLCPACGWMIERALRRSAPLKWLTLGCLGAWFALGIALAWHNAAPQLPVISGRERPDDYLRRTCPPFAAQQWINGRIRRETVAVWGEPRCFYLRAPYFWADDEHNNLIDYAQVHDGATLVAALRRLKAGRVLWNTVPEQNGGFGGPPPAPVPGGITPIDDAIARGLLLPEFESHGYRVLRLAPLKSGGTP